ncbi:hypothetical protein DB48_18050 [Shewanella sp. cp20]|nr:hypothetical protein DB48_18050 [Shewanella sp. cp20]
MLHFCVELIKPLASAPLVKASVMGEGLTILEVTQPRCFPLIWHRMLPKNAPKHWQKRRGD